VSPPSLSHKLPERGDRYGIESTPSLPHLLEVIESTPSLIRHLYVLDEAFGFISPEVRPYYSMGDRRINIVGALPFYRRRFSVP
jgi:hypothetical protein